jgi:hypothetical protein
MDTRAIAEGGDSKLGGSTHRAASLDIPELSARLSRPDKAPMPNHRQMYIHCYFCDPYRWFQMVFTPLGVPAITGSGRNNPEINRLSTLLAGSPHDRPCKGAVINAGAPLGPNCFN